MVRGTRRGGGAPLVALQLWCRSRYAHTCRVKVCWRSRGTLPVPRNVSAAVGHRGKPCASCRAVMLAGSCTDARTRCMPVLAGTSPPCLPACPSHTPHLSIIPAAASPGTPTLGAHLVPRPHLLGVLPVRPSLLAARRLPAGRWCRRGASPSSPSRAIPRHPP